MVASTVQVGPTSNPADDRLRVGECAEGVVAAKVWDTNTKVLELDYENSLAERAVWKVG